MIPLGFAALLPGRTTLALAVAALVAVGVIWFVAEERGAARERAACLAREAQERNRQAAANEAAREASRAEAIDTIERERRTAETLEEITHAPTPDPQRCGLGADGVRRLDRLR